MKVVRKPQSRGSHQLPARHPRGKIPKETPAYGHWLLRPSVMLSTKVALFFLDSASPWSTPYRASRKARLPTIPRESNPENEV